MANKECYCMPECGRCADCPTGRCSDCPLSMLDMYFGEDEVIVGKQYEDLPPVPKAEVMTEFGVGFGRDFLLGILTGIVILFIYSMLTISL